MKTHTLWQLYAFLPEHGGATWIKICSGTLAECEAEKYRQGAMPRVVRHEIRPFEAAKPQ